jgi:spore coat polysaccharide biosynthesis protein SpsF
VQVLGIIQARVSSTRLPGKVLRPILGEPMLARQIERVRRAETLDGLLVATSTDPSDDALAELCELVGVPCYRGSLDDVLDRFVRAARAYGADHVVRLTGDCPLADPGLVDDLVRYHLGGGLDYSSNCMQPSFPDGLDIEAMRVSALTRAGREANAGAEREHVTQYIVKHPEFFKIGGQINSEDLSALRWTVDEPADFEFVRMVYAALYPVNPAFSWRDVLAYVRDNPDVAELNTKFTRNEGLAKSQADDLRHKESGGAQHV